MKTQFDKIYVISLITNKDKQEFISYQMNDLKLNFEFVYGIDFYNLTYDINNEKITYPCITDTHDFNNAKGFGSTITHYRAVLQAYEFGYDNVLIIEDDVCFIKDKNLIEEYLNNIPNDADFITYDPRFNFCFNSKTKMEDRTEHNNLVNNLKQCKSKYFNIPNNYYNLCGAMMYGLMNRDTMKLYLDNQRKMFRFGDHINGFFINPTANRYVSRECLCTDQYNILCNFDINMHISLANLYNKINKLNINNFYTPEEY